MVPAGTVPTNVPLAGAVKYAEALRYTLYWLNAPDAAFHCNVALPLAYVIRRLVGAVGGGAALILKLSMK